MHHPCRYSPWDLQALSLPSLTLEDIESLEALISTLEIVAAISSLPPKTPGPDSLPGDWYKMYAKHLAPKRQFLYAHCLKTGSLPHTMYQAHIVLIPRPGKDPKLCTAYRPILLLNYDLKMLAKGIATG